jgi:uncharacterized Zn-finger protein
VNKGNCLQTVNPQLAGEWNRTKNAPLSPRDVTAGSGRKVWWACGKGHEWQAVIAHRNEGAGCPYCSGRYATGGTCLRTLNLKLAKEWHPKRNALLTPKDVTLYSHKKVWWRCMRGHEWFAAVADRSKGRGCPYCSERYVTDDNCLLAVSPKLAKEWHPTKNFALTPRDVLPHSNKKAWWTCKKGHEWKAVINNRSSRTDGCPYCSGHKVDKDNCLQTENPRLAREWHPTRNAPLTPREVTSGSGKKVWWLCKNKHEWPAVIASRNQGCYCPFCSGRKATDMNCLQTVNPPLAREWHTNRNTPVTPRDVTARSSKKAWWTCKKGHEWESSISNRSRGNGCPYCSGKRVTKENCLQTINPALAREWHPTKNGSWSPKDVAPYSQRLVWWKCVKGHEWREPVIDRYKRGGCPVCVLKRKAPRLFERGGAPVLIR